MRVPLGLLGGSGAAPVRERPMPLRNEKVIRPAGIPVKGSYFNPDAVPDNRTTSGMG